MRIGTAAPEWRCAQQMDSKHDSFVIEGKSDKKRAREYDNAVRASLLHTPLQAHIVPPVLHIILGIALDLLEYVEAQCTDFDEKMASLPPPNRDTSKPYTAAYQSTVHRCKIMKEIPTGALSGEMAHRILDNHEELVKILSPQVRASRELPVGMSAERRTLLTSVFAPLRALC